MAGKGGRKEKREAKLRDIMQDAQGNVVYTGDLYRISESSEAGGKQRQKMLLILGLVLLVLIVTGSGCIDADNAMGSFYVVLPYIGEVSALFGLVWNAVKILYPSDGVRTYVLEHSRSRIPAACRILSVFAVISFVLSLIYMIRNGAGESMTNGIAYLMLKLAAAAIAEWYGHTFKTTEWEKV